MSDARIIANGFPITLLEGLRCPYCGFDLRLAEEVAASEGSLEYGILQCDCYEYPVVAGIPVIRQISSVASTRNEAIERLRQGDTDGALQWLLNTGSAPGVPVPAERSRETNGFVRRFREYLDRLRQSASELHNDDNHNLSEFESLLRSSRSQFYADYLYYRFANPSFLAAIPPLIVLGDHCQRSRSGRLLELLCGIGHSSATVMALCSGIEVVMTDIDFVNLYIAHRFMAPNAVAICLDAEFPLPFADDFFDGVYCLDGLHYIRSKVALQSETNRVVNNDGAWLFAHLHNANATNVNPGAPLTAEGYAALFSFGEQRLIPESGILEQICREGCLDLTDPAPENAVASSATLTLFGARGGALWKRHDRLQEAFTRRPDLLSFNPLYKVEKQDEGLVATANWPSEALHDECAATAPILPDSTPISPELVAEVSAARRTGVVSEEVRSRIRSFVLVSLPACYKLPDLFIF